MGKNAVSVQNVYWSMHMNTTKRKKNGEIEWNTSWLLESSLHSSFFPSSHHLLKKALKKVLSWAARVKGRWVSYLSLCNASTLSGLKQPPCSWFLISLQVNYLLLISIRPDLDDLPGSAYQSELTGQLRADWSISYSDKSAILINQLFCLTWSIITQVTVCLFPWRRSAHHKDDVCKFFETWALSCHTDIAIAFTRPLEIYKPSLKGGKRALPFQRMNYNATSHNV